VCLTPAEKTANLFHHHYSYRRELAGLIFEDLMIFLPEVMKAVIKIIPMDIKYTPGPRGV
jgi:hypothetical protein